MANANLANSTDVPQITDSDAYYLASLYGIKSHMISFVKALPSYDDRVFHIGIYKEFIDEEKCIIPIVVKCSIVNSFDRMDMQIKFMKRLNENNVPCPKPILLSPKNIQTPTNHKYIYMTTNNPSNQSQTAKYKKVNIHCMSYIPNGVVANSVNQTDISFLNNIGRSVGKLTLALQGFEHKAADFEYLWDLQYTLQAVPKLKFTKNKSKKKLLQIYIDNYKNILLPVVRNNGLRRSVIHGDVNDLNVLCNADGANKEIIAFLDFGDSKLSCTVFEIAICCAYFMLNKDKKTALMVMYEIINSYHKIYPLTKQEISVFFVAVCSRILVSVLVGNEKIALHPENKEYYDVHSKPGWTFLEHFADTNPLLITKGIKQKLYTSKL